MISRPAIGVYTMFSMAAVVDAVAAIRYSDATHGAQFGVTVGLGMVVYFAAQRRGVLPAILCTIAVVWVQMIVVVATQFFFGPAPRVSAVRHSDF